MSNNLDKVPAHVLALAAKAEEALSYDDEGTGVLPESFFDDHVGELSEGLTGALVRQAQSAEMDFADALLLAHGRKSETLLKGNKDLDRTTVVAKAGNDELTASYDRKIMVRAPGSDTEKPKFGATSLKLKSDVGAKRGNFRRIQDHLTESAASVFGS